MRAFVGLTWMVAAGCMGPYPFPVDPADDSNVCDGLRQPGEGDRADGPFDGDGDGFVDANEPGCAEAYAAHLLDCDDGDPDVSPGEAEVGCNQVDDDCDPVTPDGRDDDGDGYSACDDCDDDDDERSPGLSEVCWDAIDNDCDDAVDPGCPDYAGSFALEQGVAYACAFDVVNLVLDEIDIEWAPPNAEATNATSQQPDRLSGSIDGEGNFVLERAIPGACDEYYRLSGQFLDADTFTALFEVQFLGSCFGCTNQSFPDLVGHRL